MRVLIVAVLLAVVASAQESDPVVRFDGHKVLRVSLAPHHLSSVHSSLPSGLDWWKEPATSANEISWADVRVAPDQLNATIAALDGQGIQYRVMIEDVQKLADEQRVPAGPEDDWFTAYHDYNATVKWVMDLANQYKNIADLVTIGKTFQGRTIYGLHITGQRETTNGAAKPGIFNDGGIHAREWIAPATVSYILFNLLDKYGKDQTVTKLVDSLDWTLVPIFNADGYSYTWTNNRMWRKTRMPNSGSSCIGTDPCRNAATGWGGGGSSGDPCSDTYRGKAAFDQVEVKAVADYVKKLGNVKYYNNYHSYSQLWMGPFGYTFTNPPAADFAKQQEAGKAAVTAFHKSHGL